VTAVNPYLLPEGNVRIAFSGGRTSAYMLRKIIDANPDFFDRIAAGTLIVSFQNTGREMPQTLDFVDEVDRRWIMPFGGRIVWLEYVGGPPVGFVVVDYASASRNGEPFMALNRRKQMLPNPMQKHCSSQLKTLTAKRYLVALGWKRWTSAIGLRADEGHRKPYIDNRSVAWLPARDAGVSRHEVALFWRQQPFDLRLPIVNGKRSIPPCWRGTSPNAMRGGRARKWRQAARFPSVSAAAASASMSSAWVPGCSPTRRFCAKPTTGSASDDRREPACGSKLFR
jgi:hypothetical protein